MADLKTGMERAVIGGIISDGICGQVSDEAFIALQAADFSDPLARGAFAVLAGMKAEAAEINHVTAEVAFEKAGLKLPAGAQESSLCGLFLLAEVYPALASQYIKAVKRDSYLRSIKREIMRLQPEAGAKDVDALLDLIAKRDQVDRRHVISAEAAADMFMTGIMAGKVLDLNTGFPTLDRNLHAQPGDLVVVGARTNVGKTTLLTNMLYNMLVDTIPCLYVPTEMKPAQFMGRLMPLMTTIHAHRLRSMELSEAQKGELKAAAEAAKHMPLEVLDIASPTIEEIRAAVKSSGCKVLFVDYLGRCSTTKEVTRMREIEKFVVALKSICVEAGIVCFLAVQLSRAVDKAQEAAPMLSDLSDSSAIEKEADLVLLLWKNKEARGASYSQAAISALIAKNRHGYTDMFDIAFDKNHMRMSENRALPAAATGPVPAREPAEQALL